jgi:hypothetical protein
VHADAGAFRSARQERITNREQFRCVPSREESLQQEQSLILAAAIITAEVDD